MLKTGKTETAAESRARILVRRRPGTLSLGLVTLRGHTFVAALGRSGVETLKREGDGAAPRGRYHLRQVLYRSDRGRRPVTGLPTRPIRRDDGWCDDPADGRYNRLVRLPCRARHEVLWRDDHVYDIVVVLSHNERPRVRNFGSAVFMHLARPGYAPTEGCIALKLAEMRRLLAGCGPGTTIKIG